jgi:hypothetical protein
MNKAELKRLKGLANLSANIGDYRNKTEFNQFQKQRKGAIKALAKYEEEQKKNRAKIFDKNGEILDKYLKRFTNFKSFFTNLLVDIIGARVRNKNGSLAKRISRGTIRELFARSFWAKVATFFQIQNDTDALVFLLDLSEKYADIPDEFVPILPKFKTIALGEEPITQDANAKIGQTAIIKAYRSPERFRHFAQNPFFGDPVNFAIWQMRGTKESASIFDIVFFDDFKDMGFENPPAKMVVLDTTDVPGRAPETFNISASVSIRSKIWKIRLGEPFTSDQTISVYQTTDLKTTTNIVFYPTPLG